MDSDLSKIVTVKDNYKCITNYNEIINTSSFKLTFDGKKFI
jgi:hypothetical protein